MKSIKIKKKHIISIILTILSLIFTTGITYIFYNLISINKDKIDNTNILDKIQVDEEKSEQKDIIKSERILQLEELRKENNDIVGWIEISGTNINYPVLQTDNNDFYLNHNYKKEYTTRGSIFLDKDVNLEGSSNYLVYGHRTKTNLMFEQLLKYEDKDFYLNNKNIRFTTLKEDAMYEILAIFYSRIYYKTEENVFRYYYFINAKNEQEYNDFVNKAKSASIYDTGVAATYGEQLLTLSTCEYSQDNGRFVVVAKKIESEW